MQIKLCCTACEICSWVVHLCAMSIYRRKTPMLTRAESTRPCQNVKKITSLTEANLATGFNSPRSCKNTCASSKRELIATMDAAIIMYLPTSKVFAWHSWLDCLSGVEAVQTNSATTAAKPTPMLTTTYDNVPMTQNLSICWADRHGGRKHRHGKMCCKCFCCSSSARLASDLLAAAGPGAPLDIEDVGGGGVPSSRSDTGMAAWTS
mmetsp:Transcript_57222/g.174199  ORF Transcript_57222/g.174199 Transcript_57222/m.174199 type:complete len:207 (+) Transcript_57222:332-952(+)